MVHRLGLTLGRKEVSGGERYCSRMGTTDQFKRVLSGLLHSGGSVDKSTERTVDGSVCDSKCEFGRSEKIRGTRTFVKKGKVKICRHSMSSPVYVLQETLRGQGFRRVVEGSQTNFRERTLVRGTSLHEKGVY